jgi:hypothetical protein
MIEADVMLRLTSALLGLWGLLNALQWLADLKSWRAGGAGGWDLAEQRVSRIYQSALLRACFTDSGLYALVVGQLLVSLTLLVLPHLLLLALFWLVTALLALRSGADGADKMALVVSVGAMLQLSGNQTLAFAGTLWIAGQLTIAYATSGWSKLFLARWRNGEAPRQALSSYMWGHRWSAALLQRRGLALALGWAVIVAEILFPLALFAPMPVLIAVLAGFWAFHWAIAWLMGINTYPWAFAAAYPSVLLLGQFISV